MSQACDGYSANCLMGNWYEEKLAPVQPFRDQGQQCEVRGIDPNISFAGAFGNLLPLERIKRAQPWSTEGLICDFGKKPTATTMKDTLNNMNLDMLGKSGDKRSLTKKYETNNPMKYPNSNPFHLHVKSSSMAKTFNNSNIHQLKVPREADTASFRSTLKPNSFMNDHFYGQTTYKRFFDKKEADPNREARSPLVGEKFMNKNQPKQNTAVQRSWYPGTDLGLFYATKKSTLPDSKTSEHHNPFSEQTDGKFRKIRSQVTLAWTKPICYR